MRKVVTGLVLIGCVLGQRPLGPQLAKFFSEVDNTEQPYALYVPPHYDAARKYPLVVSLHDEAGDYRMNLRRLFGAANRFGETELEATRYAPRIRDVDFIAISPTGRGSMSFEGIAETDVYDAIADLKRKFHIDEDRIYLTGIGDGAVAALRLAATRPSVWAAVALVAPGPLDNVRFDAANLLNVPIKIFHGSLDPLVKAADVRALDRNLAAAGVKVEYIEYPNVRHNAWDFAYRDAAIFEWFSRWKRNVDPDRVRFSTDTYKYRAAYWADIDRLTPGAPAEIDMKFTGKNTLVANTAAVSGFTLNLKRHPMFSAAGPLSVAIDGVRKSVRSPGVASFSKTPAGWIARRATFSAGEKQPGSEGPIVAAVESRHVYVYGTQDSPSIAELQRRKKQAEVAANWSSQKRPVALTLRVLADVEVSDKDLATENAVLFGSRDTNGVIARLSPKLPFRLNAGAADYGLLYIWPTTNGHYALINTGLPWWTRADQARRPGLPMIPEPRDVLPTLPDFILFKGGLGDVIVEGRFDWQWRMQEPERAKMLATGAVEFR